MEDFIKITKAISDSNRVQAILLLKNRELCVCQITKLLKLAPSTVSKHMSILKNSGLIKSRKDERWVYYSLQDNKKSLLINKSIDYIFNSFKKNKILLKNSKKIAKCGDEK